MEFIKRRDFISRKEKEDRTMPRVGTLHVSGDFDGSDNNFYPNHEIFGRCKGGKYPLYGKFNIVRDETGKIISIHSDVLAANILGRSTDGRKVFFNHSFRICDYELGEYLGEGKTQRGVRFMIELSEPFSFDPKDRFKGLRGFDPTWLNPLNMLHRDFPALEAAKNAAIDGNIGKSGIALTNVAGKKTILVGTDCVYDKIWDDMHKALLDFAPAAKPDADLAVDEASRLRDEFIKSLEKVCGAEVKTVFSEF